jgi:hypothetical protein
METRIDKVNVAQDYGRDVYDTVISARDIQRMFKHGLLLIDDDAQRGRNSVSGKQVVKQEKVERWTNDLLKGEAVFGQLTWNFRPNETDVEFDSETKTLIIRDGSATIPDSGHRHRAIVNAVDSIARGSDFDADTKFSLRVWTVEPELEPVIFYWMNQEGDKAEATRSKWLYQRGVGQRIAAAVVRSNSHLGQGNVETVGNTLSVKNPRLAAFNTISTAFEESWGDIDESEVEEVTDWFNGFWDHLVGVLPELKRVGLPQRQQIRKSSMVGAANVIHGYIRLARTFRDLDADLSALDILGHKYTHSDGTVHDLFAWDNPLWQEVDVVGSAVKPSGELVYSSRNSHQSRRAVTKALVNVVGLAPTAAEDVSG